MTRTHTLLVTASLLGGLLVPASAVNAAHLPGETYFGTTSGGGGLSVTVSPDGSEVTSFSFSSVRNVCGQDMNSSGYGHNSVVNHAFSYDSSFLSYSGTFPRANYAEGTMTYGDPFDPSCSGQVSWSATVKRTLTVNIGKVGLGLGEVTSSPAGLETCIFGPCQGMFDAGQSVTLTATPDRRSTFVGWSGCEAPYGRTCTMTMDTDKSVTATFAAYLLTVNTRGSGLGDVRSSPAGIDCGVECDAAFGPGQSVVLTAAPGSSLPYTFGGWSGCEAPSGRTCRVNMDRDKSVVATFNGPEGAPNARITRRPKNETSKRRVTFAFSSSAEGSTFECKLDRRPFAPCKSPKSYRVKPGKHVFRVRATDRNENTGRPARHGWKVTR